MPPAQQVQPAANRTQLLHVVGAAAPLREETWSVDASSPLVTSLCFIEWTTVAGARTTALRSVVGAAIILATRRSTDSERAAMRAMLFLAHELRVSDASDYLHELDKVQAFDQVYTTRVRAPPAGTLFCLQAAAVSSPGLRARAIAAAKSSSFGSLPPPAG